MATDARAFGGRLGSDLPFHGIAGGMQTELGTIIPNGKVVCYVNSAGIADGDNQYRAGVGVVSTLKLAMKYARTGRGDIIVVMAGHTENISSADYLSDIVAGTKIVGLGEGNLRPTFTWTTATSTVLIDVANVSISNCVMLMAGPAGAVALDVAAPITVSAAGFTLHGCRLQTEIDADQAASVAITTTAAADDMTISSCRLHGDGDGTLVTTQLLLIGCDRVTLTDSSFHGFTSSDTVGVVQITTTACLNMYVKNCSFSNVKSGSVHAVTGLAACTGVVSDCDFGIDDNATLAGWEVEGAVQFFRCQTSNLAGDGGADKTPVSA